MNDLRDVSLIMPVFNEHKTLEKVMDIVAALAPKEIIAVDDGSSDGTQEILKTIAAKYGIVKVYFHEKNKGKGAAIRTALAHTTGDIVAIQDADLEYTPEELKKLVVPIREGRADVVYGSRFINLKEKSFVLHYVGNKFLSFVTSLLYGARVTDMETCYKIFRREVVLSLNLKSRRFDFEPEVTARVLKKKIKIYEMPISYRSRSYEEGKHIGWRDGVVALWILLKYRFVD
jgi:glycosyltransferase involved in cell wall biosynthesis